MGSEIILLKLLILTDWENLKLNCLDSYKLLVIVE
jgi:hypothetical protein